MADHTFGTFSTDRLKFLHERASVLGVQHRAHTVPPDPLPGESFSLVVTSGPDFPAEAIVAAYWDGRSQGEEDAETVPFEPVRRYWSTPAWGYVTEWRAELPGMPEGTLLRYCIRVRDAEGEWHSAEWPDPKMAVEEALMREDEVLLSGPSGETHFALSIDHFRPPSWARDALLYHVFLDRFARDDGAPWPADTDLSTIHGGTLRGVLQKLDYIVSLGATCLWLSPLFPSPTYHRYDATDYFTVAPQVGTKEDLRELVAVAHERGIRVLLDLACNHASDLHPFFQEALAGPDNPRHSWFFFDPARPPGYRAFFGVKTMPQWNTDHPEVRSYLIDAATMWVRECDVDGFRLDYAHGLSHAFWAHFWRALKSIKEDIWCFGEIVDTPDSQVSYLGYLDGVLDFQVQDMLRHAFAYQNRTLVEWEHFLRAHEAFFPPHSHFSRPAFFDNHDTDRFLYAAGNSTRRLRLAAIALYTLPNPPILYYGTEIALAQTRGKAVGGLEVSRAPMQWTPDEEQQALLSFFRRLGALRGEEPAMRPAQREVLRLAPDHSLVRQARDGSTVLVVLNRGEQEVTLTHSSLQGVHVDLITGEELELAGEVRMEGESGRVLKRAGG